MLQLGEEKEKERVPTFSEFLQNRNSDFDSVTKVKTAERRDRFLPKKKKKQGADLVKVSDSSNVIYNFFMYGSIPKLIIPQPREKSQAFYFFENMYMYA